MLPKCPNEDSCVVCGQNIDPEENGVWMMGHKLEQEFLVCSEETCKDRFFEWENAHIAEQAELYADRAADSYRDWLADIGEERIWNVFGD